MASEEAVPSDEEEFHSAAEDGDEVEGKTEQTAVCEDEEGRTFMRAGLESLDLGAMEADMADNDRVSSNSTTADGEQAKRDSEAEGDAKMSGLDNRYVSEEHAPEKDGAVELTEEQIKELREQANKLKAEGNDYFKSGEYDQAVELYSEALKLYPSSCEHEVAVCSANRAACFMKKEMFQEAIDDCTKVLELEPRYLKAVMRRAQALEALEKYEDALEDYKRALEIDPSQDPARKAIMYLPQKIKEQQEKLKEEMIGKLKELGDMVLKPFGLSTNNFQLQQDPQSGGYSVNFKR